MGRWPLAGALWVASAVWLADGDLCTYYARQRLIPFPDILVMPTPDYAACCGICLATPACTVSVQTNKTCFLKHFNLTVGNTTLVPDPNSIVCVPFPKPGTGPTAAAYPPLPKPRILPNATFPAAGRLDSGFPRLSVADPEKLGFPGVQREGFAAPDLDRMCLQDGRTFPLPTNDWWVPIIRPLPDTTLNFVFPIPYIYDMFPGGAHLSYPFIITSPGSVRNIANRFWTLTAVEASESSTYCIQRFDELTATVVWRSGRPEDPDRSIMEMPLVRGSPYATMRYVDSRPKVFTPQKVRAFFVDDEPRPCTGGGGHKGHKFALRLIDSDEEWLLYVPPGTAVSCGVSVEAGAPSVVLQVEDPSFTGWARLALASNCTTGLVPPSPHCAAEGVANEGIDEYREALHEGRNACPMRGNVGLQAAGSKLQVSLEWEVAKCWHSLHHGTLFMVALPHHLSSIDNSLVDVVATGGHRSTRGYATPVQTPYNRWVLELPRSAIGWVETPDARRIPAIRSYLVNNDSHFDLPPDVQWGYIDPYNAGKELSRLARLAIIAQTLGEEEIARKLNGKLVVYLSVWLDRKSANPLLYDRSWGGMVSCGCSYVWLEQEKKARCSNNAKDLECPVLRDVNADFGNGHYNDHHFHYGYFLYAAAIAAHLDPAWGRSYNEKVLLLLRDIANPNPNDPYFPQFRHFDWYLGHSWASGIISSPNGKNQESTSEAANAHFGVYLWGLATNHKPLSEMGEAMLLMEAHSSKYYWYGAGGVFPEGYAHHMAGIVHDLLFEFQTYFGPQTYFVHGIHVLPLTGVTQFLLSPDWVSKSITVFDESCDGDTFCLGSGFITFDYASRAILDKDAAWDKLEALPDDGPFNVYDIGSGGGNGNSKTSTLFWCASVGNDQVPPMAEYFEVVPGQHASRRRRLRRLRRWLLKAVALLSLAYCGLWGLQQYRPAPYDRYVAAPCVYAKETVVVPTVERATPYYERVRDWLTLRSMWARGQLRGYEQL